MKRPTMLIIMDGYGYNPSEYGNAIMKAKKPNLDSIFSTYPNILLDASGLPVGLPDGQMGNSEVGHLNIGAGRIIYQDLTMITKDIQDGTFFRNNALLEAVNRAKENSAALHIFGLLSDGGVHSHIEHIKALLLLAKKNGLDKVYLHAFMDGRDVPPSSGAGYMKDIVSYMETEGVGKIGLVSGRYYIMDRDKRWERVEPAYDALTLSGNEVKDPVEVIEKSYEEGVTDEFIVPVMCSPDAVISDNDSIIFANFRPDRAREISHAIMDNDFSGFDRKKKLSGITYICMTEYDRTLENVIVAYPDEKIENTLGEYVASLGLKQLRIAETEKYAHVTFFFNGGVEEPNEGEDRILVPSPKVPTYDFQPEMSAYEVTDRVLEAIEKDKYDLIILNFANSDMVGHTGVFDAAVKAVEALDENIKKITDLVLSKDGQILLTADHGNSDEMLDKDGNIVTAHSTNPVPLVYIANERKEFIKEKGKLSDIAPTLLKLMGLDIPSEMTGDILI